MYHIPNRIYCSDCQKPHIDVNYTNHLKSKGHINHVRKNRCTLSNTNSMVVKTHNNMEGNDPNILVDTLRNVYEKLFNYIQGRTYRVQDDHRWII